MLLKCKYNRFDEISLTEELKFELKNTFGSYDENQPLTKNKCYVVYGISKNKNNSWYLITDDNYGGNHSYPLFYLESFFEVIDDRPSSFWVDGKQTGVGSIQSLKEWVEEEAFFERLVDGEERELGIFRKYKDLMDLEFSIPSVTQKANTLGDDWVMCSKCDEAWENTSLLEMVRCPKCRSIYLNQKSPRNAVADKGGLGTDNIQP